MLIFYRAKDCTGCKGIQSTIEAMRFAHKIVIVKKGPLRAAHIPPGTKPPVLVDEKEVIQGRENILRHMEELEDFKEQWYKFQSDACYCDEEGNIL